jgi:serine/threonine-protein kinase
VGDRYTLERELGRGGMATVYLARDRKHDRPVAIKIMRAEVLGEEGGQRFLREIQIQARLQHPNILALLDSGTTAEATPRPFYVMPFVEGESLRQRLAREGRLPVLEAARIAGDRAPGSS